MKDEALSIDEAKTAFDPAISQRSEHTRSILHKVKSSSPQVLIFEGGDISERFSCALYYTALLNCKESSAPCLKCNTCLQIGAAIAQKAVDRKSLSDKDKLEIDPSPFNDMYVLNRRKAINVEQARTLSVICANSINGDGARVIILNEAQSFNKQTSNALLKLLEEPCKDTSFIITVPKKEQILPTLVSRGWVLTLPWPKINSEHGAHIKDFMESIAIFLRTGHSWIDKSSGKGTITSEIARDLILALQKAIASTFAGRSANGIENLIENLPFKKQLLMQDLLAKAQVSVNNNINPALTLDWILSQLFIIIHKKD